MKKLLSFLLLVFMLVQANAQNVGIGTNTPAAMLDVHSAASQAARFNSISPTMYVGFYESNIQRGYLGSFAGNAEDFDIGTSSGNINGKLHFTIQASPRMTIDRLGNVGIGTMYPHASAILDLGSSTKGFLTPRMSSTQRNAIVSPAKGLMVYDTIQNELYYFDGGNWKPVHQKNYDSTGVDYFNTPGGTTVLPTSTTNTVLGIPAITNSGFIYDNGGAGGNYSANNHSSVLIPADDSTLSITISVEQMLSEAGTDRLYIITGLSGSRDTIATFSGTQTGTVTVHESCWITFRANATNQSNGFSIKWGRLRTSNALQNPSPHYGWHFINSKMAARGGIEGYKRGWEPDSVGRVSFAYGYMATAKGEYSTAFGTSVSASGLASLAIGINSQATGQFSTAIGRNNVASGGTSVAMGYEATASGSSAFAVGDGSTASGGSSFASGYNTRATSNYSTAMGFNTETGGIGSFAAGHWSTASGDYSVALGKDVSTNGRAGSFFFGDSDPHFKGQRNAGANDQFVCRFNGGYYFISSNAGADIGVQITPGGNAWSSVSNRHAKEKFELTDGEQVLQKLKDIPLGSWNYIGQNPQTQRHYGIMAQDFYNAYGKDSHGTIGCDTLVNPIDMQGIAFSAIQALEKRTSQLDGNENERIKMLEKENAAMRQALDELRKQIDDLKK